MPLKPDLLVWTDGSRHVKGPGYSGCAVVFGGGLWQDMGAFAVSLGVQPNADLAEVHGHIYALRFALWLQATYCPPREKRLFKNVFIDYYDYLLYRANPARLAAAPAEVQTVVGLIREVSKLGIGCEARWERRNSSHGNKEADRLAHVASQKSKEGYGLEKWVQESAVEQQ